MDHLRNELLQKGMHKYAEDVESINKNLELTRKKQEDLDNIKLEQELIRVEKERIEQEKEKLRIEAEQLRKERELILMTSGSKQAPQDINLNDYQELNIYKTNLQADILPLALPAKSMSPPRRHINIINKTNQQQHWLVEEAERQRMAQQALQLNQIDQKLRRSVPNLLNDQTGQKLVNITMSRNNTKYPQQRIMSSKPPQPQQRVISSSQTDLKNAYIKQQNQSSQNLQRVSNLPQLHSSNHQTINLNQKCSHCVQSLGQGSAMWIEKLGLAFHLKCFKCSVCNMTLGNGKEGTDVRVSGANRLHCNNCFSNDLGNDFIELKISDERYNIDVVDLSNTIDHIPNNSTIVTHSTFNTTATSTTGSSYLYNWNCNSSFNYSSCKKYSQLKSKLFDDYLILPNYLTTKLNFMIEGDNGNLNENNFE